MALLSLLKMGARVGSKKVVKKVIKKGLNKKLAKKAVKKAAKKATKKGPKKVTKKGSIHERIAKGKKEREAQALKDRSELRKSFALGLAGSVPVGMYGTKVMKENKRVKSIGELRRRDERRSR